MNIGQGNAVSFNLVSANTQDAQSITPHSPSCNVSNDPASRRRQNSVSEPSGRESVLASQNVELHHDKNVVNQASTVGWCWPTRKKVADNLVNAKKVHNRLN